MNTNLQQIRVTLDFEVYEDSFNPHQIDFHKVFNIEGGESLTVTINNWSEAVSNILETADF